MFLKKRINFFQNLQININTKKIVFFIFILYLFLRLLPIILSKKNLFLDEIYSFDKFEYYSWFQNLVQATPVHYLISKFFLFFFPINIYSLILPYIIISLLILIILIKNKFFVTRKANILFFLLFTISLPAIYYSTFIGHYGPFLLFLLLSHIYLIKCLKNKLRHIIKFFLFSFLTTLSHQVGIFFFIINIIFLSFFKRKIIIYAIIILCICVFTAVYIPTHDEVKLLITTDSIFQSYNTNTLSGNFLYLLKYFYEFGNDTIYLSYSLARVLTNHVQIGYSIYNYFFFFKAVINFYLFGQTSILSTIYFTIFLIGFVSAAIKFLNNKSSRGGAEVNINRNYFLFLIIFTFIFFYIFRFRHTFDEKYLMYLNIPVLFFFAEGIIIFLERCKKIFKFKEEISFFLVVFIFLSNFELYKKANSLIYVKEKHLYNFPLALSKIDDDSLVIARENDIIEIAKNKKIFNFNFSILSDGEFIILKDKIDLEKKLYWLSIPDIVSMKIYPHVTITRQKKVGNINLYEVENKNLNLPRGLE